jgi:hypothetical protein
MALKDMKKPGHYDEAAEDAPQRKQISNLKKALDAASKAKSKKKP